MKLRIIHKKKIKEVREVVRDVYVSGFGKETVTEKVKLGYAAILEPGHDAFFIGAINPGFHPGQNVNLVLEGVIPDASPDSPTKDQPHKDASDRGQRDR